MSEYIEAVQAAFGKILPRMVSDGGGATLASIDEVHGTIEVEMIGSCRFCPSQLGSASAIAKDMFTNCSDICKVEVYIIRDGVRETLVSKNRERKSLVSLNVV